MKAEIAGSEIHQQFEEIAKFMSFARIKGESMDSYTRRFEMMLSNMKDYQIVIPDQMLAMVLIMGANVQLTDQRALIAAAGTPLDHKAVKSELRRLFPATSLREGMSAEQRMAMPVADGNSGSSQGSSGSNPLRML